jgi:hypothetical protein
MNKECIFTDENGNEYLLDESGNAMKDEQGNYIPPTRTSKSSISSGFTTYDDSQGHCPLCGDLYCRGNCFK